MNIYKAWNKGYTGKRVIICIHDPAGVDKSHLEYASKFVSILSFFVSMNNQYSVQGHQKFVSLDVDCQK